MEISEENQGYHRIAKDFRKMEAQEREMLSALEDTQIKEISTIKNLDYTVLMER